MRLEYGIQGTGRNSFCMQKVVSLESLLDFDSLTKELTKSCYILYI